MKPKFRRTDGHRYSKLKKVYRKGKGLHNKMGDHRKGHPKRPTIGYGNDNKNKNLVQGLKPVVVYSIKDLESIDKESQAVLFSSKLGIRKKVDLLKKSEELNLRILNIDTKKFLESVEKKKKFKQEKQKKEEVKKEEYKRLAEKRKEEREKKESSKTDEEKKEEKELEKKKVIEQG